MKNFATLTLFSLFNAVKTHIIALRVLVKTETDQATCYKQIVVIDGGLRCVMLDINAKTWLNALLE